MSENTKRIILAGAKEIFLEKGFQGATMRDIAERANINKGLLHYYFKSKKILFVEAFRSIMVEFFPKMEKVINSRRSFFNKIELIVDIYIELLNKNPKLSPFIVNEINYNRDIFFELIGSIGFIPDNLIINRFILRGIEENDLKNIDPLQFVLNGLSLIIFPFLIKPVVVNIENISNDEYLDLMIKRKRLIVDTLINSLKN
jgi:AcrR family transcriptional regulator